MVNSRKLEDLDPEARQVCIQHLLKAKDRGIELLVTSTWRDFEAQDSLYQIGRTHYQERHIVTNARAGGSWHNYKVAWDVCPIVQGKPVWDANDPIWKEVIRCGKEVGAEAGADWPTFPDRPHFQIRPPNGDGSISIVEARVRFDEHGTVFTI